MDGRGVTGHLSLVSLVEPIRWQRLQDHLACVLGVPIRTVSPARELLVTPSWPSGFDTDRAIALLSICEELGQLVPDHAAPRAASTLTTPLGTTYAAVPIWSTAEQVSAYFVVGPMVVGPRESEVEFYQRVKEMGLDGSALWPVILSLKLYTFANIRSALNLMEEVGTSIAQLAYQAKQLAGIFPPTSKVDHAVVAYHTDRILHSLLEAATAATRADGGSVMVFDSSRETLQVKTAQGLSDAAIATPIRRGEGLAGLAAQKRATLLIDDQTTDLEVKGRMRRPDLVSSLVAPLMPDQGQEPIGVLNLRTTNPQRRFTREHVEVLQRLLDLTGVALTSLRAVFQHASKTAAS